MATACSFSATLDNAESRWFLAFFLESLGFYDHFSSVVSKINAMWINVQHNFAWFELIPHLSCTCGLNSFVEVQFAIARIVGVDESSLKNFGSDNSNGRRADTRRLGRFNLGRQKEEEKGRWSWVKNLGSQAH